MASQSIYQEGEWNSDSNKTQQAPGKSWWRIRGPPLASSPKVSLGVTLYVMLGRKLKDPHLNLKELKSYSIVVFFNFFHFFLRLSRHLLQLTTRTVLAARYNEAKGLGKGSIPFPLCSLAWAHFKGHDVFPVTQQSRN